jgi:hypothetical protein
MTEGQDLTTAEDRRQRTDDRGQMTENRGQSSDDIGKKDRGQKTVDGMGDSWTVEGGMRI